MTQKRFTFLLPVTALAFFLFNCSMAPETEQKKPEETNSLSVLVWNTQALFDGSSAGNEYDEYRESAGWNEQKYAARILSVSQAIESAAETGSPPDLIGLEEIENLKVLEDLAKGPLAKYGYEWIFFGNVDGTPLGTGALSRLPMSGARVHSITAGGETAPRPVLEIQLEAGTEKLIFFICHWKSKIGGTEATEPLRRASARVINRRIVEIRAEEPDAPVVIMGDLNENHDEFYRQKGDSVCALLPDDPQAAELASAEKSIDFLVISAEKPPNTRFFNSGSPVFYTPWGNELENGSYYYRKNWETIDHFLLNAGFFDNRGWEFEDCRVLAGPPFTDGSGYPDPYTPRNGLGLSDHLPLLLQLKKAEEGAGGEGQ